MHIHWHNYEYTLHDNWMVHFDVHKCRCGSEKIKTGNGYSPYRFYPSPKQIKDVIGRDITKMLAQSNTNEIIKQLMADEFEKLIGEEIRIVQKVLLDALIDLFTNPPAQIGAAEDLHLNMWQIKKMLELTDEQLAELDEETKNELRQKLKEWKK